MNRYCDRCGKDCKHPLFNFVSTYDLIEVMPSYQRFGVKYVCSSCGDKATSFLNYYGRKKKSDVYDLMCFLQSGPISKPSTLRCYSGLMNGGYFEQ